MLGRRALQGLGLLDIQKFDAVFNGLGGVLNTANMAEAKFIGRVEAGQALLPERLMIFRFLRFQPANEITVRTRRRQIQAATFLGGAVAVEEVHHDDREAPGIHQDVVIAAHELVGVGCQLVQPDPHQRGLGKVQSLGAFLAEQLLQAILLLTFA
ncbi:hypothetical protein D3C78_1346350 [compost metagenome]